MPNNNIQPIGGDPLVVCLARTYYAPGAQQTYNIITAGTVLTAIDTNNATVGPFQVPASGYYWVDVRMDWGYQSNASLAVATDIFLGIAAHGSTVPLTGIQSVFGTNLPNIAAGGHAFRRFFVQDTPNITRQIDLIYGMSSTTNITFAAYYAAPNQTSLAANPTNPLSMEVFAAG